MSFEYFGPSLEEEKDQKPYDHHCPLMGSFKKPNTYLSRCISRQNDKRHRHEDCFGGCKAEKKLALKQNRRSQQENNLTRRQVYKMIDAGYTNNVIAKAVGRAWGTVAGYREEKLKKGK